MIGELRMSFEEKTSAEKRFEVLWDAEIAPILDSYAQAYNRNKRLFISGVITIIILWPIFIFAFSSFIPVIWASFIISTITVSGIWASSLPFRKTQSFIESHLRQAVSKQFADILLPSEQDDLALKIFSKLKRHGLIRDLLKHQISNHYCGTYRQCELRIFNMVSTAHETVNDQGISFFCISVTVPPDNFFQGSVIIDSDLGRVRNSIRKISDFRNRVPFDHPQFEKKFEVFAENEDLARRLISHAFCDNLLDITDLLGRDVTGAFFENQFTLLVTNSSDFLGVGFITPKNIEKKCRELIATWEIIPSVVDYLHGER